MKQLKKSKKLIFNIGDRLGNFVTKKQLRKKIRNFLKKDVSNNELTILLITIFDIWKTTSIR